MLIIVSLIKLIFITLLLFNQIKNYKHLKSIQVLNYIYLLSQLVTVYFFIKLNSYPNKN